MSSLIWTRWVQIKRQLKTCKIWFKCNDVNLIMLINHETANMTCLPVTMRQKPGLKQTADTDWRWAVTHTTWTNWVIALHCNVRQISYKHNGIIICSLWWNKKYQFSMNVKQCKRKTTGHKHTQAHTHTCLTYEKQ